MTNPKDLIQKTINEGANSTVAELLEGGPSRAFMEALRCWDKLLIGMSSFKRELQSSDAKRTMNSAMDMLREIRSKINEAMRQEEKS